MNATTKPITVLLLLGASLLAPAAAAQIFSTPLLQENAGRPPGAPSLGGEQPGTVIEQKLGAEVALDAEFVDQDGKQVRFGDLLDGKKPALLTFIFSDCQNTCSVQLDMLSQALRGVDFSAGRDYHLIAVSLDHEETPEKARKTRDRYLAEYTAAAGDDEEAFDRSGATWTFLTGTETEIRKLADSFGYGYEWVGGEGKIAHFPALLFITPKGKIARYLGGLIYDRLVLRMTIFEAGEGTIGTVWDQAFVLCFYYDPMANSYVIFARNFMTAGGALTVLLLGWLFWRLRRYEIARRGITPAAEVSHG
jgi:protein SCO1/2